MKNLPHKQTQPYEAVNEVVEVDRDDLVVMGTDGLWDNVPKERV